MKKNIKNTIKALPIGISDYVRAQSEYYYVDKTMMIKEFLAYLLQIGAITRTTANRIAESLYANDLEKLQKAIAEYMDRSVSFMMQERKVFIMD